MVPRWGAAVILVGVLAGCSSTTDGEGAPNAAPLTTAQGLPVPDDRVEPTSAPAPSEPAPSSPAPSSPAPPAPATTPPVTTPAPTTGPAGRACPADVARTLPGGGPATLVAGFGTARFRLFICRTDRGALYYRGISRADAARATTLAARTVPGGYEARGTENGDTFVYRIAQGRLSVTKNGSPLFTDPVTSTL